MSNTPVLDQNIGWYLSGYADGEGSFCISFSLRSKLRAYIEVRPSFSVSQNSDRKEVLELFQTYFDCGTIRPDRSDKTVKYEVRSLRFLVERIIPHFRKYPLKSSKQRDFEKFAVVCELMERGEHRKKESLKQIVKLASGMNIGGIRKYSKEYLLHLVR